MSDIQVRDLLVDIVPGDMDVPVRRLEFSFGNVSWLCRNLPIRNGRHLEIKQTMAKLNMLRQDFNRGQWTKVTV